MAIRVAFLRAEGLDAAALAQIRADTLADTFGPRSLDGFLLHQSDAASIAASYVLKLVKRERLIDPWGKEFISRAVKYVVQDFRIELNPGMLIVDQPVQGFQPVFSRLSRNAGVAWLPCQWDVKYLANKLCKTFPRSCVSAVTVGDVTVSNITVGTIRLESSGDVRGDVDKYFRGTSIRLQSARVRVKIDSAACSCEIFKNGRLLFSEDAPAELRDGIICIVMEHKR